MTLNSLNGTECSTEIIKKINDIIAQKATISLSNLDSAGEQRFTTLAQGISDANDLITALTTVVGTKLSAEVSLQQNGYIKFSNKFIICWAHVEFQNISTVQSTKSFTLPISMTVYGESVTSGTRMTDLLVTAFNYNNSNKSTYTVGFYNGTGSKQSINVYVVLFGTE